MNFPITSGFLLMSRIALIRLICSLIVMQISIFLFESDYCHTDGTHDKCSSDSSLSGE